MLTLIGPCSGTQRNSFSILARIILFHGTHQDSSIFRCSHWLDPFLVPTWTVFRYSHRFYLFPVLARIRPFFGIHIDWTLFHYPSEQFFDTRTDYTFSWYSPGFFHFSVLTLIGTFSGTHLNSFSILARILPFPGTCKDSTIFRYSHDWTLFLYSFEQFFDTRTDSTFFLYSPRFFHFSVHTLIGPFSGTHPNRFSILARIPLFPGIHPDSSIIRCTHWLDPFSVFIRIVFRYSHGLYFFLVLTRILPFFGAHIDWTLFWNPTE